MPRNRIIKVEFWSDEKIGQLSFMERLLFIGMWNFADDEGLIKAHPSFLKSTIFPYDDSLKTSLIEKAIIKFESLNMIYRYKINGQNYLWIIKFRIYQRIDKPQKSITPLPSLQNTAFSNAIHKRDRWICHLCGKECSQYQAMGKPIDGTVASIDHIIPKSKGGNNAPSNLKTACVSCNKSRGNKGLDVFLKEIGRFQDDSENILRTFQDEVKESKEKKKENKLNNSPEPSLCDESGLALDPVFISLPLKGSKKDPHQVTESKISEYENLFPAVDIRQELRNMRSWCDSNPTRQKTKTGILQFISRWLTKTQNRGGSGNGRDSPINSQAQQYATSFEEDIAISLFNGNDESEFLKYCEEKGLEPKEIKRLAKIKKNCGGNNGA